MTRNLEGVVLKKKNWRENDLEIIFFSKEWGKMRLLAIGARKFKSKLSGHLEPFNELRIMLADGRTFDKIGQAVSLNNFLSKMVSPDWQKNLAVQQAAELLDKILPEKQGELKIYQLFKNYLLLISKLETKSLSVLFKWQAIVLSGFGPVLDHCAHCGGDLSREPNKISVSKGGLLCTSCSSINEAQNLSKRELNLLRHLVAHSGLKTAWIKLKKDDLPFLEKLFIKFYSYHILK